MHHFAFSSFEFPSHHGLCSLTPSLSTLFRYKLRHSSHGLPTVPSRPHFDLHPLIAICISPFWSRRICFLIQLVFPQNDSLLLDTVINIKTLDLLRGDTDQMLQNRLLELLNLRILVPDGVPSAEPHFLAFWQSNEKSPIQHTCRITHISIEDEVALHLLNWYVCGVDSPPAISSDDVVVDGFPTWRSTWKIDRYVMMKPFH
jgi:hypothetical protein